MNQTYNKIKKTAYQQDKNCCTVISASVAFEKDYQETYEFFKARGRKNGKGLATSDLEPIYRELADLEGFKITKYIRYINTYQNKKGKIKQFTSWENEDRDDTITVVKTWKGLTLNNFRDYLPKGDYILGVSGHVTAVKGGIIQDWSSSVYSRKTKTTYTSRRQVDRIYKIEKKNKVFKDLKKSKYDFSKFV